MRIERQVARPVVSLFDGDDGASEAPAQVRDGDAAVRQLAPVKVPAGPGSGSGTGDVAEDTHSQTGTDAQAAAVDRRAEKLRTYEQTSPTDTRRAQADIQRSRMEFQADTAARADAADRRKAPHLPM